MSNKAKKEDITGLLNTWRCGDLRGLDELYSLLYDKLKCIGSDKIGISRFISYY